MFFHLVHSKSVVNSLVFTKSAESTTRLVQLFQFFEASRTNSSGEQAIVVRPYSSDLSAAERKTVLEKFKKQEIHMCAHFIPDFFVTPTDH